LGQAAKQQNQDLELISRLAQKAHGGDTAAFDKLVDIYWADIYRLMFYRVSSQMDAEDLAQEVFLKAYRNITTLKEPERFKAWLYSIAVNLVKDYYRRRNVRAVVGDFGEDMEAPASAQMELQAEGADETVAKQEVWAQVEGFKNSLPPSEQEVFTLRFMDGLNIREIAETLKRSESAVKTHLYRAVGKFKNNNNLLRVLRGEA
jgi:RNA polymerase sigma-70 factor (ECF subfamily)